MRNLKILVTVVDKTQKPLDDVKKRIKSTGKAAQEATVDITKFNRGLFSATAVAGTFIKGFMGLGRAIEEGVNWDRLSNQFERVMGPKGAFLDSISSMTDVAIDKMEALRAGLSLANLGIAKDSGQLASLIARAGVAAKLAGKDSAEGIKEITEFMKTGNISNLQNLDLISQSNVALKLQQAVLGKVGGVMGGVITLQHRLAVGQALLDARTRGQLKGFADLKDVVGVLRTEYQYLRNEFGVFIGKAILPLAKHLTGLIMRTRQFFESVKNNKQILFFAKSMLVAAAAVTTLIGTFATLKGVMFALSSLGFGLPRLIGLTIGLGSAFIGITKPVKSFTEKLQLLGAVFKGVYELVTTLNSETGIAKMSKSTYLLLKQNGLLGFVQFLGRSISVVKTVVSDMYDAFKWLGKKIDDVFGGIATKVISIFDKINKPWENFWVSDAISPVHKFVRSATVLLGGFGAFVASIIGKKILGSALSKIPIVGKLFGGASGGGPRGTKGDPMFIKDVDKQVPGAGLLGKFAPSALADTAIKWLKQRVVQLAMVFNLAGGGLRGVFSVFSGILRGVGSVVMRFITPIIVFGSALLGAAQGIYNTASEWKAFFAGIFDLGRAVFDVSMGAISSFGKWLYDTVPGLSYFVDGVKWVADTLLSLPKMIMDGWRMIFELLGTALGPLGKKFSEWARKISPDTFKKKPSEEVPKLGGNAPSPTMPDMSSMDVFGKGGNRTAAVTSQPADPELDALNELGESLQNTPNSSALTMQKQYEKMLAEGKKPSEIAAETLGTKLDDTNSYLEGILRNTQPNRSLQSHPMSKREK